MKKTLFSLMTLLMLAACTNEKDVVNEETGGNEQPAGFRIALMYDSVANTVAAMPTDSTKEYTMFVWLKEDYIADYGDDISNAHVKATMQSYIDMCIEYSIAFPTFRGFSTVGVYDGLDREYPGAEMIAMAAEIDVNSGKIVGEASWITFVTSH